MNDDYALPGPDVFAKYLRALPHRATCGKRQAFCNCPISEWLRTVFPYAVAIEVDIDLVTVYFIEHKDECETPSWMFAFIRELDTEEGATYGEEVTSQEALRVLNKVMSGGTL